MNEHTCKIAELFGTWHMSIDVAVQNAITTAGRKELRTRWIEFMETRGHIENGTMAHW